MGPSVSMRAIKRGWRSWLMFAALVLVSALLVSCGGGGGDKTVTITDTAGGDPGGTGIEGDVTLSGTALGPDGKPLSSGSVFVFSDTNYSTEIVEGAFSLDVSPEIHTLLLSTLSYADTYQLVDLSLSQGEAVSLLLQDFEGASAEKRADANISMTASSVIGDVILNIAAQASRTFDVGDDTVTKTFVGVELHDTHSPIPFPLPTLETRDDALNAIYETLGLAIDRQVPIALVSVKPALLKNLDSGSATLTMPYTANDDPRIMHFDPETHNWTSNGLGDNNGLGAVMFSITEGGVYGIFQETEAAVGHIRENLFLPKDSIVQVSDRIYTTVTDNETIEFLNVVLPLDDEPLNAIIFQPATDTDPVDLSGAIVSMVANGWVEFGDSLDGQDSTAIPGSLSLSLSKVNVLTDGADTVTVTAKVLDVDNVPLQGTTVIFSTTGGEISASSMVTDASGNAIITFSPGSANKSNRTVTITAETDGLSAKNIPIQVSGTTVKLSVDNQTVVVGDDSVLLTVEASDAGGVAIYDAAVNIAIKDPVTGTSSDKVSLNTTAGNTSATGTLDIIVTGQASGEVLLEVSCLGVIKTQNITVFDPSSSFGIIAPETSPYSWPIGIDELTVQVNSPSGNNVVFGTTIGTWSNGSNVIIVTPVAGLAEAHLKSNIGGLANIQVQEEGSNGSISGTMQVAFSAAASSADKILLQAAKQTVAPSLNGFVNSVTLTATVRDDNNQGVGNALVAFSLDSPINGGEYLAPQQVYTNDQGIAETIFYSGSLPSGAGGVTISAAVVGSTPAITDSTTVIINGGAGSVALTSSTKISTDPTNTFYTLPFTVLVADSNGSPLPEALVSLNLWPKTYNTGYWYSESGDDTGCVVAGFQSYTNEDVNRNLILDECEDIACNGNSENPGHGNGLLTPPNTAVGVVPAFVTTDENGIATFDLTFLKEYAVWIGAELTATTMVIGSEKSTTIEFILPILEDDAEGCDLSNSPFNPANTMTLTATSDILPADGETPTTVSARVTTLDGSVVVGENVQFTTTIGDFDLDEIGTQNTYIAMTNESGIASVELVSTIYGFAEVRAEVVNTNIPGTTNNSDLMFISFTAVPTYLSMSASSNSVSSDNVDSVTITATVLDANRVPLEGESVTFKTNDQEGKPAGELSASIVSTDANGEASVFFSAGTPNSGNMVVNITAVVNGLQEKLIPIQIAGTTLTLSTDTSSMAIGGDATAALSIFVANASSQPIYDAEIDISIDASSTGSVSLVPADGSEIFRTNVNGELKVDVTAMTVGDVLLRVTGLGTTATQAFSITALTAAFGIAEPVLDIVSAYTAATTHIGPNDTIAFSDNDPAPDSLSRGDGGDFVTDGFTVGGVLTVSGSASNDGTYKIADVTASSLTLDGTDVLTDEAPGLGVTIEYIDYSAKAVTVTVDAPDRNTIYFATTVGRWLDHNELLGNFISVAVVDDQATASLVSTAAGLATVQVADADDTSIMDTVKVAFSASVDQADNLSLQASETVLAPSVGDISNQVDLMAFVKTVDYEPVGNAPVLFTIEEPTGGGEFISPVFVMTDYSGLAKATFTSGSLSSDARGVTVVAEVVGVSPSIQDEISIKIGGTPGSVVLGHAAKAVIDGTQTQNTLSMSLLVADSNGNAIPGVVVTLGTWPLEYRTSAFDDLTEIYAVSASVANEDVNRNLVLDEGEDVNSDGFITPHNSAAGTLPTTVTTDENGVAFFELIYLSKYAFWIEAEVSASLVVQGTETRSSLVFVLPLADGQELLQSPFSEEP